MFNNPPNFIRHMKELEMSEINFGKTVSLAEAEDLIVNVPQNRFMLRGEPGIGKSSMLERIGKRTGLPVAYIDEIGRAHV